MIVESLREVNQWINAVKSLRRNKYRSMSGMVELSACAIAKDRKHVRA